MNLNQHRWWTAIAAIALSLPVLGQVQGQDYRYPNTQPAPQVQQTQQAPQPVQQPAQQQAAPPPLCNYCGTVDSIRTIEKPGEGSAVGVIAGGLLGGLLGHQVEKNVKKVLHYEISVRMDDGSMRNVSYDAEPGFRTGDKVRFIDGRLTRY